MSERHEHAYDEDEIKARLERELPHWHYEDGWIKRKYRTHSWKSTLMVINTVGHLAEAAWHHPDMTASYAWVEVRLKPILPKGLRTRISNWRKRSRMSWIGSRAKRAPRSKARHADDQRFAYIKYDK